MVVATETGNILPVGSLKMIWWNCPPEDVKDAEIDQSSEGMAVEQTRDVLGQPDNTTVFNHLDLQTNGFT